MDNIEIQTGEDVRISESIFMRGGFGSQSLIWFYIKKDRDKNKVVKIELREGSSSVYGARPPVKFTLDPSKEEEVQKLMDWCNSRKKSDFCQTEKVLRSISWTLECYGQSL